MKRPVLSCASRLAAAAFAALAFSSCATGGLSDMVFPEPDKAIALTFDDGPFGHTDRLLAILAEHDVRATFFVIGRHVQQRPEQARRIALAGHELGNHSWSHSSLGSPSPGLAAIRQELGGASDAIAGIAGEAPAFFRAPNLNYGPDLAHVAREMGMAIIGASAIGRDWESIGPAQIAANVIGAARDGGIILLHEQFDGADYRTERALPEIIRSLRMQGFAIMPLGELVESRGAALQPGALYNSID